MSNNVVPQTSGDLSIVHYADAINDSLYAISARRVMSVSRWCCSRYDNFFSWIMYGRGYFGILSIVINSKCCAVALLEY